MVSLRGWPGRPERQPQAGPAAQETCPHGRQQSCSERHDDGDDRVGEPLCSDCYDYPARWRSIGRRRSCGGGSRSGCSAGWRLGSAWQRRGCGDVVRISYAKVAEFQRRGVVHFHAIIRLDGPGDEYADTPARLADVDTERSSLGRSETRVSASIWGPIAAWRLGFGEQLDVRLIRQTETDDRDVRGPVTAGMVAAYIAKYATKAAEDFGLDNRIRSAAAAEAAGLRPHIARMIVAAEALSGQQGYAGMLQWVHMLGFRGHFTTKSRRFSVTLGSLRGPAGTTRSARNELAGARTSARRNDDRARREAESISIRVSVMRPRRSSSASGDSMVWAT